MVGWDGIYILCGLIRRIRRANGYFTSMGCLVAIQTRSVCSTPQLQAASSIGENVLAAFRSNLGSFDLPRSTSIATGNCMSSLLIMGEKNRIVCGSKDAVHDPETTYASLHQCDSKVRKVKFTWAAVVPFQNRWIAQADLRQKVAPSTKVCVMLFTLSRATTTVDDACFEVGRAGFWHFRGWYLSWGG